MDSLKGERSLFLEYKQCEVTKENVKITDQIYEELKEIRSLQKKKQALTRERYELLDQSQPLRWNMMQDRVKMKTICEKSLKERECWERRKKLMESLVGNVGAVVTTKEAYINTALDVTQRYMGDHLRRLLNTKMEYILQLARSLSKETDSMNIFTKKKVREKRMEQANEMVKNCEKLHTYMNDLLKQCATSEKLWGNGDINNNETV